MTKAQWVCVKHRAYRGPQAKYAIRDAGFECLWPRLVVRKFRQNDSLEPLFPGYLFARIDAGMNWGVVSILPDVQEVLRAAGTGQPSFAPSGFCEALITRAGAIDLPIDEIDRRPATLRPGPVQITGGPFDAFKGLLTADKGEARLTVLLDMMGAQRSVQVPRKFVVGA